MRAGSAYLLRHEKWPVDDGSLQQRGGDDSAPRPKHALVNPEDCEKGVPRPFPSDGDFSLNETTSGLGPIRTEFIGDYSKPSSCTLFPKSW